MPKLFRSPRVRIGKNVGVNISRRGVSGSIRSKYGTYNTRKGCSPKLFIVLLAVLVLFVLNSCYRAVPFPTSTPVPPTAVLPTATEGPAAYVITKSTGLYGTIESDEPFEVLQVGVLVIPANNQMFFECEVNTDSFKLCRVKVIETGKTGWVLQKWMLERYSP